MQLPQRIRMKVFDFVVGEHAKSFTFTTSNKSSRPFLSSMNSTFAIITIFLSHLTSYNFGTIFRKSFNKRLLLNKSGARRFRRCEQRVFSLEVISKLNVTCKLILYSFAIDSLIRAKSGTSLF